MTGCVVWFTGPPAAGKTTIAEAVEARLLKAGVPVENLDGDAWRALMSPDLGYGPDARDLNTKRLAHVAAMLARHGVVALVACVSPLRAHRDRARAWAPAFVEVAVAAPPEVLRARDPKGLYARVDRGEVNDVAGLHTPYEAPAAPEARCLTHVESVGKCVKTVLSAVAECLPGVLQGVEAATGECVQDDRGLRAAGPVWPRSP